MHKANNSPWIFTNVYSRCYRQHFYFIHSILHFWIFRGDHRIEAVPIATRRVVANVGATLAKVMHHNAERQAKSDGWYRCPALLPAAKDQARAANSGH